MKKRFSKAARQTMLAAVTLALLLAPFVYFGVQKARTAALDSAFLWTIHAPHDVETYLSEHGLRYAGLVMERFSPGTLSTGVMTSFRHFDCLPSAPLRCTCCSCLHFTDFSSANNPPPFRLYFSRKGGGSL